MRRVYPKNPAEPGLAGRPFEIDGDLRGDEPCVLSAEDGVPTAKLEPNESLLISSAKMC